MTAHLTNCPAMPATFAPIPAILRRRNLPEVPVNVIGITMTTSYSVERGEHYRRAMAMLDFGTIVGLGRVRFISERVALAGCCPRCGQTGTDGLICPMCRARDRAPQGETARLFTPTAPQPAGALQLFQDPQR